jgi:hypothetical protein
MIQQIIASERVTEDAKVILTWCAANLSRHTRRIAGKDCPVVNIWWHGMARALGYEADCRESLDRALKALQELHEAGLLARYDEGPNTYGHTTTCFVPQA